MGVFETVDEERDETTTQSTPTTHRHLFVYLPKREVDIIYSKFHSGTGKTDRRMYALESAHRVNDITESVVTIRSPFCGNNLA